MIETTEKPAPKKRATWVALLPLAIFVGLAVVFAVQLLPGGKLTLVNVWGSWCVPCRQEHPLLMEIAEDERIRVVGLNYKDQPENARRFLGDLGNPFAAVGADRAGRSAIEWGVYGVPETFLVDEAGKIVYKHVGPFTPDSVKNDLMPAVAGALRSR